MAMMAAIQRFPGRVLAELGLLSLYSSATDTKLLCLQRFVRMFAYGGSTLVLALYLSALGSSDSQIGLFMTVTMWGDVIISLILTLVADGVGRKTILAAGAVLMTGSGVVFAITGNYWVLLAAAIFGVISPNGNEIGPFRAIEESTIAHLTSKEVRADIFAWYTLIGTAGAASGLLTCGWTVGHLQTLEDWNDIAAYRAVFWAYAAIGIIKLGLALALSNKVELEKEPLRTDPETAPLLHENDTAKKNKPSFFGNMFPHISPESRTILVQLCLLFALDNFASGLASLSWIPYFFKRKFDMPDGFLGTLFFTTSIIAAFSALVAASLARRIGNIKTMVFTHLPSSICLALIPIPNSLPLAATLLILRSCTQSMDAAPRSAFMAAIVLPAERTAVMGIINMVKTFSTSIGPSITGTLASKDLFWVAFVMAGSMKAAYDLGLLAVFAGHVTREDKDALREEAERAAEADERAAGDVVEEEVIGGDAVATSPK